MDICWSLITRLGYHEVQRTCNTGFFFDTIPQTYMRTTGHHLAMTIDRLGLIELLEILLLFLCQDFPFSGDGLVQPLNLAKANDGARNSLVDPRQSNVRDLPGG